MIAIAAKPGGELAVSRGVGAGEIALGQHIADQPMVVQPADHQLRLAEAALALQVEDLAIAVGVVDFERLGNAGSAERLIGVGRQRRGFRPPCTDTGTGVGKRG